MLRRTWASAAASALRRRSQALFRASRSFTTSSERLPSIAIAPDVAASTDNSKKHVVVGMSGGVDSSVAALLLKQQGYRVTGVYMKNWDPSDEEGESACPVDAEYLDVQKVCEQLGIEAQMVNLVQSYWNQVFAPCLEGYEEGLTPNPDILCNREIKFKAFTEYAKKIGADYVATGHYAALRPAEEGGRPNLCAAKDDSKDQSYFLSSVDGRAFANVLFPLGDMCKTEVRRIAASEGLCTATKKDSVGICFIGKRNFADFIHQYIQRQEGYFYTVDGEKMHQHHGFTAYTVGQGARLQGMSAKWFVVGKHKSDHSVIVAEGTRNPALFSDALFASAAQFNWMAGDVPQELRNTGRMRCFYRVRYRQDLDECTISLVSNREARASASKLHDWQPEPLASDDDDAGKELEKSSYLRVDFDHPQRGVTPEQALVLYRADGLCYGGGPITAAGETYYEKHKPLADDVHDWHRQG
ncbi:tRNA (5-methylaminomethyl-2-thiouridylate)-methyltransferase [Phytophthora cinnamomi]|uniref:tRNA (5-methylaminomethyl-2-thiouridylate)-methyltransferase n=1 Tax=Phytophthora cinnamomi TaxID=4785 RepID=UPI003559A15C|nr:tRNA (5-methylaminomethyl-2-thiouridylate)-methyltransferase [Phytophthora cinnamomi]